MFFTCQSEDLLAVIHKPEKPLNLGVLIVVGGPQYRVGSHRQFVLLARKMASHGVPVMRFDYRGMGDAGGEAHSFASIDKDIEAAINTYYQQCPTIQGVVLWGLCDAATAALFYAYQDFRVKGLVLLNPWVYTEQGSVKTYLKKYYVPRLLSLDLWKKVFKLNFSYHASIKDLFVRLTKLFDSDASSFTLPQRLYECFRRFEFPVLFILSTNDLTASEFKEMIKSNVNWQASLLNDQVQLSEIDGADHTFSSVHYRQQVEQLTLNWVLGLFPDKEDLN